MIKNKSVITASSFLSMFFLGIGVTIIGATARDIGLTPFQIGLLLTVQNIGFAISVITTGILSDVYEKPKILFVGSLVLALSFYFFYSFTNSFGINLIIIFFIGVGVGSYEGVSDVMLLDIHKKREGFFININHSFVTLGQILIIIYIIFLNLDWRNSLTQSSIFVLMLAFLFILIKLKAGKNKIKKLSDRLRILKQDKIVILLFLLSIFIIGLETAMIGLLTTFLMNLRDFTQVTSKIGLIIFLSGAVSGRIIIGIFTKNNQILDLMILLLGMTSIFLTALFFLPLGIFIYCMIFLCGITLSSLLPLLITFAGLIYKEMSGTVIGVIKIAIPTGGILVPFLFSIVTKCWNFQFSLLLFPIISLTLFFILFLNRKNFDYEVLKKI